MGPICIQEALFLFHSWLWKKSTTSQRTQGCLNTCRRCMTHSELIHCQDLVIIRLWSLNKTKQIEYPLLHAFNILIQYLTSENVRQRGSNTMQQLKVWALESDIENQIFHLKLCDLGRLINLFCLSAISSKLEILVASTPQNY